MVDTHAQKGKRKLMMIDNALLNATAYLLEYYYLMLRADLGLAAGIEVMLLQTDQTRAHVRDLFVAAWGAYSANFDTVGCVPQLVKQAREDVLGRQSKCRAYLNVLDLSAEASLTLLRTRAEAYSKPSTSQNRLPLTSQRQQ